MTDPDKKDEKKPGPLQVVGSVISAAFGVQTARAGDARSAGTRARGQLSRAQHGFYWWR